MYVSSPVVAPAINPAIYLFYLFQAHQQEKEEEGGGGGGEISFDSHLKDKRRTSIEQKDTHNVDHTCENFGDGKMRTANAEGSVSQKHTMTGGRPKVPTAVIV